MSKRSELQLFSRAVKQRWPVSDRMKKEAIDTCRDLMRNGNHRTQVAALKVLAAIEAQNQKDEHANADLDEFRNQFIELARQFGIDESVLNIEGKVG